MNKLIQSILSPKWRLFVAVIFLAIIVYSIYAIIGVRHNLQKMAAAEDVTYFPSYPAVNTQGKNPEQLKRGEYLTKAGDCIACHTNSHAKEKAQVFAGGLPMHTPFGTIYTPNITPDKETGIGNWTNEQFIKAMREGVSPTGHFYYPAFPYLYFNNVSDEDLIAIKAYLDSTPAVKQANLENDMLFPFNWRFVQLGWRILFFYPNRDGVYKNEPEKSEKWNRGAYLIEGLGHCAMCHTPSYHLIDPALSLGAPIRKYGLTGSKIQGHLAPDITGANFATISEQEIIEVFTKDKFIGGGKISGPMLEVNHDSLQYLTTDDLSAMANYLKAVHSETPPKPKGSALGKGIYEQYCAGCHAMGGGGAPKLGDATTWDQLLKPGIETVYTNAIQGKGGMPAKGTCLSCNDDEIKQAVDYMVAAVTGETVKTTVATPKPVVLTMEDGKRIYEKNCSVCHASGFKNAPKPGDKAQWEDIIDKGFLDVYLGVLSGKQGHPVHGACEECSDADIKAAVKYMMQESSTGKDFSLW